MAYTQTNSNEMKFVLTNAGKKLAFEQGLSNIIKYFSLCDDDVIYTMDVEPDKLKAINGYNEASTDVKSCGRFRITK